MQFRTIHLVYLVIVAAFVLGVATHPSSLRAVLVPLVGGVCVVLPVLGTAELLSRGSDAMPRLSWGGTFIVAIIGALGIVAAAVVCFAIFS